MELYQFLLPHAQHSKQENANITLKEISDILSEEDDNQLYEIVKTCVDNLSQKIPEQLLQSAKASNDEKIKDLSLRMEILVDQLDHTVKRTNEMSNVSPDELIERLKDPANVLYRVCKELNETTEQLKVSMEGERKSTNGNVSRTTDSTRTAVAMMLNDEL